MAYENLGNEIFGIRTEHSTLTPATPCSLDFEAERWNTYAEYLNTNHWQTMRGQALKRFGFRCAMCNQNVKLEVHHRTYERLGCELLEDLLALCRKCHGKHHEVLPKWSR